MRMTSPPLPPSPPSAGPNALVRVRLKLAHPSPPLPPAHNHVTSWSQESRDTHRERERDRRKEIARAQSRREKRRKRECAEKPFAENIRLSANHLFSDRKYFLTFPKEDNIGTQNDEISQSLGSFDMFLSKIHLRFFGGANSSLRTSKEDP